MNNDNSENQQDEGIRTMPLYGGPHDGEEIEIHCDNLKCKPSMSVWFEGCEDEVSEYALDNDGKFVWLPDPSDPKVQRGWFVCDDDGNVISSENSDEDALRVLDQLEGSG